MLKVDVKIPKINYRMKPALNKALRRSVTTVRNRAVKKAPYKSGTLRRSIIEKVSNLKGTVGTNLVYASIHEYGGVIRPKKAKYLSFKIGNKRIRTKKVTIPARPYMRPALEESKNDITRYFAQEIDSFLSKD